ncbi:MAG: restriction endonuclease subunit S [Candidatus Saccharimonadales bacterium]
MKLEEFDIIVPLVGTLGNSIVIFDQNLPVTANQNLAQIKPDKAKVDPIYLGIFLCSKYGKQQFERAATGNVQPWLNLQQIQSLKVCVATPTQQQSIRTLALQSLDEYKKSFALYSKAEEVLLQEVGISEADFGDELSYLVDFSEADERVDAEYFQPKYQKLVEKVRASGSKKLGDLVSIKKGFEPGSEAYQDEGKLFIRVSSLSKFGVQSLDQKYLSEELYENLKADYQPRPGEILLSKDATPGTAYVLSEPIDGIISGGILRLKLKVEIDPEYLALVINSLVGQMQAERDAGGSVIKHWKPDQIKSLEIPILPKTTQENIGDLVRQSHAARRESKELLEQAKREVEDIIELQSRRGSAKV